jgi:hypothetical protein
MNRQVLWEWPNISIFCSLLGIPIWAILKMVMVMCLTRLSTAWMASSRNFYKMVCILYNVLATIYLTKPSPPEQYFTHEAAPGYGCDECVTRDIGHTNFNPPPTTSTTTQSGCIRYVFLLLILHYWSISTGYRLFFPERNHPKACNTLQVSPYPPTSKSLKNIPDMLPGRTDDLCSTQEDDGCHHRRESHPLHPKTKRKK